MVKFLIYFEDGASRFAYHGVWGVGRKRVTVGSNILGLGTYKTDLQGTEMRNAVGGAGFRWEDSFGKCIRH